MKGSVDLVNIQRSIRRELREMEVGESRRIAGQLVIRNSADLADFTVGKLTSLDLGMAEDKLMSHIR